MIYNGKMKKEEIDIQMQLMAEGKIDCLIKIFTVSSFIIFLFLIKPS